MRFFQNCKEKEPILSLSGACPESYRFLIGRKTIESEQIVSLT